jgi:hypothetical protein
MTTSTDRTHYRALVAQVAEQARAMLPTQVNGRLESAVKLVLLGDVLFLDDGTAAVHSSSDPGKTYTLAGGACDCQDVAYGKAPAGWCQHKIAANIQRSVERVLARCGGPAPVPGVPDVEPWPDNDPEPEPPAEVPMPQPLTPPAPALPEAPASVNCRLTIGGREVQLTLRDTSEARVLARLEEVLQRYPLPQPTPAASPASRAPAPAPQGHGEAWCTKHHVQMPWNEGKNGRKGWHSHRTPEGQWCKGK